MLPLPRTQKALNSHEMVHDKDLPFLGETSSSTPPATRTAAPPCTTSIEVVDCRRPQEERAAHHWAVGCCSKSVSPSTVLFPSLVLTACLLCCTLFDRFFLLRHDKISFEKGTTATNEWMHMHCSTKCVHVPLLISLTDPLIWDEKYH
jgi:hypothetical protein